jgi:hypothetical protein
VDADEGVPEGGGDRHEQHRGPERVAGIETAQRTDGQGERQGQERPYGGLEEPELPLGRPVVGSEGSVEEDRGGGRVQAEQGQCSDPERAGQRDAPCTPREMAGR